MSKIWSKVKKSPLAIPVFAIAARAFFILQEGHTYDIATFHAWASNMLNLGPRILYEKIWTDYLPLPLYVLTGIKSLALIPKSDFEVTLKTTLSFIEVFLIYVLVRKEKLKNALALALAPALIINTALWGQIDGIVALLLALAIKKLCEKRDVQGGLLYGLALATKPIVALAIIPVASAFKHTKNALKASITIAAIVTATAIFAAPSGALITAPVRAARFLLEQATYQASVYPFTTINALNFWALKGSNWITDQSTVLGITSQAVGLFLFSALAIPLLLKQNAKQTLQVLAQKTALIFLLFYTFATRMHERHMLYALPLLYLGTTKSKPGRRIYWILNVLYAANLWIALAWNNSGQVWPVSLEIRTTIAVLTSATVLVLYLWPHIPTIRKSLKKAVKNRALIGVLALALGLRVVQLGYPNTMIFDEVYHAFTAQEMLKGNKEAWEWWNTPPEGFAYEWTHPPIAKYGMVAGMLVFGKNAFGYRAGSAVMGALSIYLLYRLTKIWTKSKKTALFAAALLSIEGLHLVQSRVAMNDIYMVGFTLASLLSAGKTKWKHASVLFGLALASKWSAIYALIPLTYIFLRQFKINLKSILVASRLLLVAVIVYTITFTPFFLEGHTYDQFIELHRQMWYYHTHLDATHAYQSYPWEWVVSLRPVWYFVDYLPESTANIYAQANPMILWLGLIALATTAAQKVKNIRVPQLAYLAFLLPWLISPRIMFFYHYLPSVIFLIPILAIWLSSLPKKYQIISFALCTLIFALLAPLYYAIPMPGVYWDTLFAIFPSWK